MPRKVEIWLSFYPSSFGLAWVLLPRSLVSSKGDVSGQELSDSRRASLGRLGCCSSVRAHRGERGTFIFFNSFICIGQCWHSPFGQINFFTHHHFQDRNTSSPYTCHYHTSLQKHLGACLPTQESQQLFLSHPPSPPSLLGHAYVNISRKGCSVGKTSLALRSQHL